jgi:hypothetical protein
MTPWRHGFWDFRAMLGLFRPKSKELSAFPKPYPLRELQPG